MSAIKSTNRVNAYINKNFVIRVYDLVTKKCVLRSANTLSRDLDTKRKISLFNKLMTAQWDKHTFLYRNRLKIEIHSK